MPERAQELGRRHEHELIVATIDARPPEVVAYALREELGGMLLRRGLLAIAARSGGAAKAGMGIGREVALVQACLGIEQARDLDQAIAARNLQETGAAG